MDLATSPSSLIPSGGLNHGSDQLCGINAEVESLRLENNCEEVAEEESAAGHNTPSREAHGSSDSELGPAEKKSTPRSSDGSLRHKYHMNRSGRPNRVSSRNPNLPGYGEPRIHIYTSDEKSRNNIQSACVKVKEIGTVETEESTVCSLYITSCLNQDGSEIKTIAANVLEGHLAGLLTGNVRIHETSCSLVVEFAKESDLEKVVKLKMNKIFEQPIIVWAFPNAMKRYRKIVTVKDIPWCVPIIEIQNALRFQGIKGGKVTRKSGTIRIEIRNASDLQRLLHEGLSFFDCATFPVALDVVQHEEDIIQCYRCQRFWHTAANCHYTPRCVRCGLNHDVSSCVLSRNSAKCCLCGGPHHAAHKMCPVRLQHINALQVEMSLSKEKPFFTRTYYD